MVASKAPVRVAQPTAPPPDYRLDLSRRALAGFLAAGFAVAFLIFLSGLVMGVRLNLDPGPDAAVATAAEGAPAVAAPEGAPPANAAPAGEAGS